MKIVTLFYMMLYIFINISIQKFALVKTNYFITILFNKHLKKHKNNTNNYVRAYIKNASLILTQLKPLIFKYFLIFIN